ncbi:type I-C CRISPR-associated protein Cas7/Csd2 [Endozoicomonadaceae bacterium StTr2]
MSVNALKYPRDIFFIIDIENGNPNGDPDDNGSVRYDDESRKIEITGVCIKRKIRNRVAIFKSNRSPWEIYYSDSSCVLNDYHQWAIEQADIKLDESKKDKKQYKIEHADRLKMTKLLCSRFFDLRAFGAPLRASEYPGEVITGPCQIPMIQSINEVVPADITITRQSVTNERDADKEATMGSFSKVRHAVFIGECIVSAYHASKTGFSEEDFDLLIEAIDTMFEEDRSYNRVMNLQGIIIFKHDSPLRNAKRHVLKQLIEIRQKEKFTETFNDYEVTVNEEKVPEVVSIERNDFKK